MLDKTRYGGFTMFKFVFVFSLIFSLTGDLFCAEPVDDVKNEIKTSYGDKLNSTINDTIYNFKVAKGCIELEKMVKCNLGKCTSWLRAKEGRLGAYYNKHNNKQNNYNACLVTKVALKEVKDDMFIKLKDIVRKDIFKDIYSVDDLYAVIDTLSKEKVLKVNRDEQEFKEQKEELPKSEIFFEKDGEDISQNDKNSLIAELLDETNYVSSKIGTFSDKVFSKESKLWMFLPFGTFGEPINKPYLPTMPTYDHLKTVQKKMLILLAFGLYMDDLEKKNGKINPKNFESLIEARAIGKEQVHCPNTLHMAILRGDTFLVDYIIKKAKELYKDDPKDLVKYLNKTVYNKNALTQAQGNWIDEENRRLRKANKEANATCSLCASVTPSYYNDKQKNEIDEQSSLNLAYLITSVKKPKEALDISILLLKNGADYLENIRESRGGDKDNPTGTKYSSTIFKDFLMIGFNQNNKQSLKEFVDEKKEILRLIVSKDKKGSSDDKNVKLRYEALLEDAAQYDEPLWCNYILNELTMTVDDPDDDEIVGPRSYRSAVPDYVDGYGDGGYKKGTTAQKKNNKDSKGGKERNIFHKIFGLNPTVLSSAKENCKPLFKEAGEKAIGSMKFNLATDVENWKRGERVYSILHIAAQDLIEYKGKDRELNGGKRYALDENKYGVIEAVKGLPENITRQDLYNFIMSAQDTTGKRSTPWQLGLSSYFGGDEEALKTWINTILPH